VHYVLGVDKEENKYNYNIFRCNNYCVIVICVLLGFDRVEIKSNTYIKHCNKINLSTGSMKKALRET